MTDIFRTKVSSYTIFQGFWRLLRVLVLARRLDACAIGLGGLFADLCQPSGAGTACACWRVGKAARFGLSGFMFLLRD